jgi:hypothetical protein
VLNSVTIGMLVCVLTLRTTLSLTWTLLPGA